MPINAPQTIDSTKVMDTMLAQSTTKQVATRLNVTTNTVRNWSEIYAERLSESARPGAASERRFSERDITIFEYIQRLKSEGLREGDIKERLKETTFTESEVLTLAQSPAKAGEPVAHETQLSVNAPNALASPDAQPLTPALIVVVNDLEKRFDAKLAALEQASIEAKQSQRAGWWWLVAGIAIGLALAALADLFALVARLH